MVQYNNYFKHLSRKKAFEKLEENVFEIAFDKYIFTIGCIGYYVNLPEIELTQHAHPEFFEIHYISRGTETCITKSGKIKLSEGMSLIIPAKKHHAILTPIAPELELYAIGGSIRENPALKGTCEDGGTIYKAFNTSAIRAYSNLHNVIHIFDAIYRELLFFNDASLFNIKLNITRILFETAAAISREDFATSIHHKGPDDEVYSIIEYIHANLNRDLPVEKLADIFCRSQRQFMRIFKHATGESVGYYIRRVRMEYARDLLEKGELPLKVIAEATGFSNEYNFSIAFKKHTGISPSYYRKQYSSPK